MMLPRDMYKMAQALMRGGPRWGQGGGRRGPEQSLDTSGMYQGHPTPSPTQLDTNGMYRGHPVTRDQVSGGMDPWGAVAGAVGSQAGVKASDPWSNMADVVASQAGNGFAQQPRPMPRPAGGLPGPMGGMPPPAPFPGVPMNGTPGPRTGGWAPQTGPMGQPMNGGMAGRYQPPGPRQLPGQPPVAY